MNNTEDHQIYSNRFPNKPTLPIRGAHIICNFPKVSRATAFGEIVAWCFMVGTEKTQNSLRFFTKKICNCTIVLYDILRCWVPVQRFKGNLTTRYANVKCEFCQILSSSSFSLHIIEYF